MNHLRSRILNSCDRSFLLLLCLSVLPWSGAVFGDAFEDYDRVCWESAIDYAVSAPHLLTRTEFNDRLAEGTRSAEEACAAFLARLARLSNPTAEERLVLMENSWTSDDDDYCGAAVPLAEALPDNAEALQIRSACASDRDESIALLLRSLEVDPRHRIGLTELFWEVSRGDAEVDAETLLRHWNTNYDIARSPNEKASAAALIYSTAIEAGDEEAAEEIRVRVRADLGLDSLEFERREAALELVCDRAMLELDLEELCTGGFERVAAQSAALGDALAPDILRPLEGTIRLISGTRRYIAGGGGPEELEALERLQTVLGGYPDHLKSSEHLRVYAEGFLEGADRIETLRRATRLDPGNLAARCGLAKSLERTSPEEAWSIYTELAARPADLPWQCDPEVSLQRLENRAATGRPENEVEEIFLHF